MLFNHKRVAFALLGLLLVTGLAYGQEEPSAASQGAADQAEAMETDGTDQQDVPADQSNLVDQQPAPSEPAQPVADQPAPPADQQDGDKQDNQPVLVRRGADSGDSDAESGQQPPVKRPPVVEQPPSEQPATGEPNQGESPATYRPIIAVDPPRPIRPGLPIPIRPQPNPCMWTKCGYGANCVPFNGGAKCQCPEVCPLYIKEICGSDGKIYGNECFMNIAACKEKKQITQRPLEECPKTTPKPSKCTKHY